MSKIALFRLGRNLANSRYVCRRWDFDPVFEYKEKLNQDKTAQEYKEYYTKGYQTDIASIKISEKEMAFTFKDGTTKRSNYRYVGKKCWPTRQETVA